MRNNTSQFLVSPELALNTASRTGGLLSPPTNQSDAVNLEFIRRNLSQTLLAVLSAASSRFRMGFDGPRYSDDDNLGTITITAELGFVPSIAQRIRSALVLDATPGDDALLQCLAQELRQWVAEPVNMPWGVLRLDDREQAILEIRALSPAQWATPIEHADQTVDLSFLNPSEDADAETSRIAALVEHVLFCLADGDPSEAFLHIDEIEDSLVHRVPSQLVSRQLDQTIGLLDAQLVSVVEQLVRNMPPLFRQLVLSALSRSRDE